MPRKLKLLGNNLYAHNLSCTELTEVARKQPCARAKVNDQLILGLNEVGNIAAAALLVCYRPRVGLHRSPVCCMATGLLDVLLNEVGEPSHGVCYTAARRVTLDRSRGS